MPVNKGRFWLTQDSQSIVVSTDRENVYELVADLPRMGEWSPECERVDWLNGTSRAVEGAEFVGHNRGGPFKRFRWSRHGRVLTADTGREFAFVTDEGGRESTVWRYRFEPVAGGTRVTESYEVKWIPVWARIVDVPANRHGELREAMRHTLEQLKAAAEAPAVVEDLR
jgi:Polyketide cyclase / dehydrase and lipid transport